MRDIKPINMLSVVIPVYNEEESLPELLQRTSAACDSIKIEYEILLVDDGSSDRSAELIEQASVVPGSRIKGVLLNRNYGQHSAIMAGFSQ
ncbi:glycosyltransferase, partial [Pantoea allii]